MSADTNADRAEHRFSQPKGIARLWAGLLLAPAAWAVQMGISYALVPALCQAGAGRTAIFIVGFAGLAIALVGVWFAFLNWRDAGKGWRATGKEAVDRARFMAVTGLLLGGYVSVVIVLQLALSFGLDHCA
jgi:hypothetical protein